MMMNTNIKIIKGTVIKDSRINEIKRDMSPLDRIMEGEITIDRMNRNTLVINKTMVTLETAETEENMAENENKKSLKTWMKTNMETNKTIIKIIRMMSTMKTIKTSCEDHPKLANGKIRLKVKAT
jgi:hypothetical protein